MKKIIASLVLAIMALFSFGCAKEMPYNVLYDAKFVDKSEKFMTEEFLEENRLRLPGEQNDLPRERTLIIDNEEEFNRAFVSFPCEVDFAQDILVIFMFVDTNYGFDCKLKDMYETENELIIDIHHEMPKHNEDAASQPTHRCSAVKLTNCKYPQIQIKFKR